MSKFGHRLRQSAPSVPLGYTSVTQMLAQPIFYAAHRGGSRDFPEMSLYAYQQSMRAKYPAIEFSVARTSDGVFFGLHDATLDRTSGVSGVDPTTLTWAQIQAGYQILGSVAANNTTQPNRPYMRFEDLVNMYYSTHVIFIDPKNLNTTQRTELLNLMGTYPQATSHFIGKYYGVAGNAGNTTGPAAEWASRGYKTWGYFYDTDSANYAAYQGRWDILGLNYTAASNYWTTMLSYGKPVMGHICPDQASVTTALSKGAVGVMVSGVLSAIPPAVI